MDDDAGERSSAACAVERGRRWLKSRKSHPLPAFMDGPQSRGVLEGFLFRGFKIQRMEPGRVSCTLKVPSRLADARGEMSPAALAAMIDTIEAVTAISSESRVQVSVDFNISYISAVKVDDEIEIDARVGGHKGGLSAVFVEVRNRANGELVASGRQWMHGVPSKEMDRPSKL